MTQLPFTFGNALMHITRTGGPRGFIWKFALAYGAGVVLLYALMMWSFAPIFSTAFAPGVDEEAMDAAMLGNLGRILSGYLIAMAGGLVLWILFEAASQRRYMRAEGFSLRLGADEGRLFVVGLIFFGMFIASYIVLFILMAVFVGGTVAAMGEDNGGIASLVVLPVLMILYFVGLMFVMVRFSPAASLTIRDRAIRFSSAWRVSKGKGWAIFGSWMLLYIAMYAALIIIYLVLAAIAFAAFVPALSNMQGDDPEAMMQLFASPGTLAGAAIGGFVIASVMGVFIHAFGGPAALAARTDPEWVDQTGITDTFG